MDGAKGRLLSPELIARNLTEFSRDVPPITADLRLPDWRDSVRCAWPPPSVPASVLVAQASLPNRDPRYTADWAAAAQDDIARRIADEQQRIADEAARSAESKREYERALPR